MPGPANVSVAAIRAVASFARAAKIAVGQVLVPSGAADGDGPGVGEIARRDMAKGHPAINALAGVLLRNALAARRIADLTFGTLDVLVCATRVGITAILGAGIAVIAIERRLWADTSANRITVADGTGIAVVAV